MLSFKRVLSTTVSLNLTIECGTNILTASNRNEYQVYFLGVKAAGA